LWRWIAHDLAPVLIRSGTIRNPGRIDPTFEPASAAGWEAA
jgi:hypothetical protein